MGQKKKWTDHPSINQPHPTPSHPPVNKKSVGVAWYPVAGVLGESTERLLKSPLAHTNTGPTVQIRVISLRLGLVARWNLKAL